MALSRPRRVAMAHVSIGLVLSCEFFKTLVLQTLRLRLSISFSESDLSEV